jgi:hypothetical protein
MAMRASEGPESLAVFGFEWVGIVGLSGRPYQRRVGIIAQTPRLVKRHPAVGKRAGWKGDQRPPDGGRWHTRSAGPV